MAWSNICIPPLDMTERVRLIQVATNGLINIEIRAQTNKIALLKLARVSAFIYGAPIVFFVAVTPPLAVIVIAGLVGAVALLFILKIAIKKYKPIRQFNRYNNRITYSLYCLNNLKENLISSQFNKCIEKINNVLLNYNTFANNTLISDINSLNRYIYDSDRNLTHLKNGNHIPLLKDLLPFEKHPCDAFSLCFEMVKRTNHKTVVDDLTQQLLNHGFFIGNADKIPLLFYTTLIEKGESAVEHLAPLISEIPMDPDQKINLYEKIVEKSENSKTTLPKNIIFPNFPHHTADERLKYYKNLLGCPRSAKFMAENPSHLNLTKSDPKERIQFYSDLCKYGLLPEKLNQLDWTDIQPDDRLRFYTDIVKVGRVCNVRAVELAQHIHEIDVTGITTTQLFELFKEILLKGGLLAANGLLANFAKLYLTDVSMDQLCNFYQQIIASSPDSSIIKSLDFTGIGPSKRLQLYKQCNSKFLINEISFFNLQGLDDIGIIDFYIEIANKNISISTYNSLRQALNSGDLQEKFDVAMIKSTIHGGKYLEYLKTLDLDSAKWLEIAREFCKSKMRKSSNLKDRVWDYFVTNCSTNCSGRLKRNQLANYLDKDFLKKELLFFIPRLNEKNLLNLFDDSPQGIIMFIALKDELLSLNCISNSIKAQLFIQSYRPSFLHYRKLFELPNFLVEFAPFLKILKSDPTQHDFDLSHDDVASLRAFILQNKKISFLDSIITRKKEELEKLNDDGNLNFKFPLFMHWIAYVAANLYVLPEKYVQRFHSQETHDSQETEFQMMSNDISFESSICDEFDNQRYALVNRYVSDVWGMSISH
jgi:hypothetical protein